MSCEYEDSWVSAWKSKQQALYFIREVLEWLNIYRTIHHRKLTEVIFDAKFGRIRTEFGGSIYKTFCKVHLNLWRDLFKSKESSPIACSH